MKRPGMNFYITKYVIAFQILFLLNLESRNISATSKNMQHILSRTHKSRTSDADELRYGLPIVSLSYQSQKLLLCALSKTVF